MAKRSAGILMFRLPAAEQLQVLLVHPGGPLWARKDDGAWSIAKGEYQDGEEPKVAAVRELAEETGITADPSLLLDLGDVKQKGGKVVLAWALEGDFDPAKLESNYFEMEWPRGSSKIRSFPEVDRASWFPVAMARKKILSAQDAFLDRLIELLIVEGRASGRLREQATAEEGTLF